MSLRASLKHVTENYQNAIKEVFTGHDLANFVRHDLRYALQEALGNSPAYKVASGAGNSSWATIPWLAVLDPTITTSALRGYYIVYLISDDGKTIYLSLNQGATSIYKEFGEARGRIVLKSRASMMREKVSEYVLALNDYEVEFFSKLRLPKGYVAGHVAGIKYYVDSLPNEKQLLLDLEKMLKIYSVLEFRGGNETEILDSDERSAVLLKQTMTERRRYSFHRRIDRNSAASRQAKKVHKCVCAACGFDFKNTYGTLGEGVIEAHHKIPLSDLKEGEVMEYDLLNDFVMLCSNCHKMIHKMDDPSDVQALIDLINAR
ncbi:MrcB family domain-containing protein [Curvivirga sp.]|uniref:MrcB family domain-containing protein n=1 Tax=Curvivirga sp. TaxID=2856848 RepID=UPI003B5B0E9C